MKALSTFLPFVIPHVPGCSDPMAEQAILTACIDLCDRSSVHQSTSSESAQPGQSDYDVEVPRMATVATVLAVFYRQNKLTAASREMVSNAIAVRGEPVAGDTIAQGTPQEWFCRDPVTAVVSIYPPPAETAAGAVTIVAAFKPQRTATQVADFLFDDYADDVAAGAIARLLNVPAQLWTNPVMAKPFADQFNRAVSRASIAARVGLGMSASRVRPRFFA